MRAARKTAAAKTTTSKSAATKKTAAKRPARKSAPAKTTEADEKRATPGRPPLLEVDPEIQQKVVTYVRAGAFPERAAVAAGISERSHYAWMALGRDEQDQRDLGGEPDQALEMYVRYAIAVERAVAEAEMLLMGNALKGGPTGNASQTILERRFKDRWGVKATPPAAAAPAPTAAPVTGLDMLEQRRRDREQATH